MKHSWYFVKYYESSAVKYLKSEIKLFKRSKDALSSSCVSAWMLVRSICCHQRLKSCPADRLSLVIKNNKLTGTRTGKNNQKYSTTFDSTKWIRQNRIKMNVRSFLRTISDLLIAACVICILVEEFLIYLQKMCLLSIVSEREARKNTSRGQN